MVQVIRHPIHDPDDLREWIIKRFKKSLFRYLFVDKKYTMHVYVDESARKYFVQIRVQKDYFFVIKMRANAVIKKISSLDYLRDKQ